MAESFDGRFLFRKTLSFRFKYFLGDIVCFLCCGILNRSIYIKPVWNRVKKLQLFSLKAIQPSNNIAKRQPANNNWECINPQVHWNPDLILNHSKSNYLEVSNPTGIPDCHHFFNAPTRWNIQCVMLFRCPMHVNRLLSLSAGLFDIPQLYIQVFSTKFGRWNGWKEFKRNTIYITC